jgi:glycosyltransferase involved in cell wall biosynthesis
MDLPAPKTIMLVANTSWSLVKFRLPLIKSLLSDGHRILLAAPEDDHSKTLSSLGATFIPLMGLSAKGKNPLNDLRFLKELTGLYRHYSPDLIFHYTIKPNIYGSWAAATCGIPSIAVVTGLGYTFIKGGWMTQLTKALYKKAFLKSKEVWFLNEDDEHYFRSQRLIEPQKIRRLPGEGVDTEEIFNPQFFPVKSSPSTTHSLRMIFVGRMLYDKGLRELVEALRIVKKSYPSVSCDLLGYVNVQNPSAIEEAIITQWQQEGVINYLGSTEDVRPIMLNYDCLVLPSYREGMSTTLQEAASLGLPLIATKVSGCKELIDDGVTGFLCEPKSSSSLAASILHMLELSKQDRVKMGQRGREKMQAQFSSQLVYSEYVSALARCINK